MLEFGANVLTQAFTFGVACLGAFIAFRVVRYPDLTGDGSFMLGSSVFAAVVSATNQWLLALACAAFAGAVAGCLTAALNALFGISRLLSGVLTSMAAYSVAFRLLSGRPNWALPVENTMFAAPVGVDQSGFTALIAGAFALALWACTCQLLRSQFGLFLRATGANADLIVDLGRAPALYRATGLAVANALIAISASLVSSQQGFMDINLGVGVIVTLIAALVLGEQLVARLPNPVRAYPATCALGPFVGASVYFALVLFVLRASIEGWLPITLQPTDLKLISAGLVILVVAIRRRRSGPAEEVLPL